MIIIIILIELLFFDYSLNDVLQVVADAGKDATAAADDSMQQSFEEKRAENVPMEESPAKEEKKDEGNTPKKAEMDVTVCEFFFPFFLSSFSPLSVVQAAEGVSPSESSSDNEAKANVLPHTVADEAHMLRIKKVQEVRLLNFSFLSLSLSLFLMHTTLGVCKLAARCTRLAGRGRETSSRTIPTRSRWCNPTSRPNAETLHVLIALPDGGASHSRRHGRNECSFTTREESTSRTYSTGIGF